VEEGSAGLAQGSEGRLGGAEQAGFCGEGGNTCGSTDTHL